MGLFDRFKKGNGAGSSLPMDDGKLAPRSDTSLVQGVQQGVGLDAEAPEASASCLGRWARVELAWDNDEPFIGYVYFDQQAGLSAKGGPQSDPGLAEQPTVTLRLPIGPIAALDEQERLSRQLPSTPSWLQFFGEQPSPDAPWRSDPQLRGRAHPSFPDDFQVLVHDGEPRRTGRNPEVCWVRIVGAEPSPRRLVIHNAETSDLSPAEFGARYRGEHVFRGRLLNAPHGLENIQQGEEIRFLTCTGADFPLMATEAYLTERELWGIMPCSQCGFAECLDPPSVMARLRFPDMPPDADMQRFTAFCPVCDGMLLLAREPDVVK